MRSFKCLVALVFLVALSTTASAGRDNEPLRQVDTLAPPLKYGVWIDLQASSGSRGYVVSAEITNGAKVQVYGEVEYVGDDGKTNTMTFANGSPARFTTGNVIARIRVRVKTGGPTGAGVRITQR